MNYSYFFIEQLARERQAEITRRTDERHRADQTRKARQKRGK